MAGAILGGVVFAGGGGGDGGVFFGFGAGLGGEGTVDVADVTATGGTTGMNTVSGWPRSCRGR